MYFTVKTDTNVNVWGKEENASPVYRSSSTGYWMTKKYECLGKELNTAINDYGFYEIVSE